MILEVDLASETPIYQQIRDQIVLGIAKNEIELNENLPSVRQLADDLDVNMMTVSKAYTLLKNQGYVETDRRQGTKIVKQVSHSPDRLPKLHRELELLLAEAKISQVKISEITELVKDIYLHFESEV